MPFVLNDICVENNWSKIAGPKQFSSDVGGDDITFETLPGLDFVSYQVVFTTASDQEFEDLLDFFLTYRFTRSFDWKPPDELSSSKYRFQSFSPSKTRPWRASATLEKYLGV